jgi:FMN phosphatase YigB (HAD superfamily)
MTAPGFVWDRVGLVVFDVDGTLYRHAPLMRRMVRDMLVHTVGRRDPKLAQVIWRYRRIRERMGDEEVEDFAAKLVAETAARTGLAEDAIAAIVEEWIERRPLPHLPACRCPLIDVVFSALRRRGILIGIWSDYPAADKVQALGLAADLIVTAHDVGVQKPHSRGLERLLTQARVGADETVLIGDRVERDGMAARRAGTHVLIRSDTAIDGWQTFRSYGDAVFRPLAKARVPVFARAVAGCIRAG